MKKILSRLPRGFYESEDLQCLPVDGQLYADEPTPIKISRSTVYLQAKLLESCDRRGFRDRPVIWKDTAALSTAGTRFRHQKTWAEMTFYNTSERRVTLPVPALQHFEFPSLTARIGERTTVIFCVLDLIGPQ
jgi:hypothetical protein